MTIPIAGPGSILPASIPQVSPKATGSDPGAFQKMFESSIQQVNADQNASAQSIQAFLSGESEDLHTAALATQRAELSFEMFMQVRNKVVQAYQEVMRMQI